MQLLELTDACIYQLTALRLRRGLLAVGLNEIAKQLHKPCGDGHVGATYQAAVVLKHLLYARH
jgi:hypothetical protein